MGHSMRIHGQLSSPNGIMRTPMRDRLVNSPGMAKAKAKPKAKRVRDFTQAENAALRAELAELYKTMTQEEIASAIGNVVGQPTLSAFLSGRQGTSHAVAERVAVLRGKTLDQVLGRVAGPAVPRSPKDAVRATDLYKAAPIEVRRAFDQRDPYSVENPRLTVEFYTRRLLQHYADHRDGVLDALPPQAVERVTSDPDD